MIYRAKRQRKTKTIPQFSWGSSRRAASSGRKHNRKYRWHRFEPLTKPTLPRHRVYHQYSIPQVPKKSSSSTSRRNHTPVRLALHPVHQCDRDRSQALVSPGDPHIPQQVPPPLRQGAPRARVAGDPPLAVVMVGAAACQHLGEQRRRFLHRPGVGRPVGRLRSRWGRGLGRRGRRVLGVGRGAARGTGRWESFCRRCDMLGW